MCTWFRLVQESEVRNARLTAPVDGAQLEESRAAEGLCAADAAGSPGLEHEFDLIGGSIRIADGWRSPLGRDEVVDLVDYGGRLELRSRRRGGWAFRIGGRGDGCQCEEGEVPHGDVVGALGLRNLGDLRDLDGDRRVDNLLHN